MGVDLWHTCNYSEGMPKMIQIRNVPDGLHRRVKARAAQARLSMSEFLLREIERVAERPPIPELAERLATRSRVKYRVSPAQILREQRGT
jgi:plasmid stability protein